MEIFDLKRFLIEALGCSTRHATLFFPYYLKYLKRYGIDTPDRLSAFFATLVVESGYFARLEENLNYSANRLAVVWPSRYRVKGTKDTPNSLALKLHRNPKLIANHTYANRGGNGDISSGDGYRYRGRGPIQITLKDNYIRLCKDTGLDCVNDPDLLLTPDGGALSSCHYWHSNNLNKYADIRDIDGVRDLVNMGRKTKTYGDANGFKEFKRYYEKAVKWFKDNHITEVSLPLDYSC